ncbi:MAG: GIY-YIG nuclease family protein [Absicoccus sp.]|uniref:GIY-YIG nuclease family protein n=1 Tax=Absicoccus intestinalis TaxID=2926319 RepID=A0ABU4WR15_9FIRM|nr:MULTISPECIES: GIY-YIG nuclease family protein [unclassified Absicoccus]MDX8417970.1 GIY-YIG nuclease family protein [Absicoccus sp. CLA-KB-P134]MDY3035955.1 GIY-YIG nuclease family protein [Absicoccus sp.]
MNKNYVYIVECADTTYYTGWTNDLEKRIHAHNVGKGAKYTKSRRPVRLVYYETFATKQEAMGREYAIKQLSRQEKAQLIKAGSPQSKTVPNNKEHDSQ